MIKPLAICFFFLSPVLFASVFDSLESEFAKAVPADVLSAYGYWAGNCTEASEPNAFWPGILVVRQTPTGQNSFSYYWERGSDRDFFRRMKPQDLEKHSGLAKWLSQEQWNEAAIRNGALCNHYSPDPNTRVRRELRHTGSEFDSRYLLRVVRINGLLETTTSYCEFDQHQGLYRQQAALFGTTGPVSSETISIRNQNSNVDIERLEFLSDGPAAITLKDMKIIAANGSVSKGPTEWILPANSPAVLARTATGPRRIIRLEFTVVGFTSGLNVTFYSIPSALP